MRVPDCSLHVAFAQNRHTTQSDSLIVLVFVFGRDSIVAPCCIAPRATDSDRKILCACALVAAAPSHSSAHSIARRAGMRRDVSRRQPLCAGLTVIVCLPVCVCLCACDQLYRRDRSGSVSRCGHGVLTSRGLRACTLRVASLLMKFIVVAVSALLSVR